MKFIYIIGCVYKNPTTYKKQGSFQTLAFKTEKEAKDYCEYHSTESMMFFWTEVGLGKFEKPKSRRKPIGKIKE